VCVVVVLQVLATTLQNVAGGAVYVIGERKLKFTNVTLTSNVASTVADSSVLNAQGGGVFVLSNHPEFENVTFRGNVAYSGGGAFFGAEAAPTLRNSSFIANVATVRGGGGLACDTCRSIAATSCSFLNNVAAGNADGNGGGVLATSVLQGSMSASDRDSVSYGMQKCLFQGNRAGLAGGGAWIDATTLNMSASTFYSNTADVSGGGAVFTTLETPAPVGVDGLLTTQCVEQNALSCDGAQNCARFGCAVATPPQRLRVHTASHNGWLVSSSPPGTDLVPALVVRCPPPFCLVWFGLVWWLMVLFWPLLEQYVL